MKQTPLTPQVNDPIKFLFIDMNDVVGLIGVVIFGVIFGNSGTLLIAYIVFSVIYNKFLKSDSLPRASLFSLWSKGVIPFATTQNLRPPYLKRWYS